MATQTKPLQAVALMLGQLGLQSEWQKDRLIGGRCEASPVKGDEGSEYAFEVWTTPSFAVMALEDEGSLQGFKIMSRQYPSEFEPKVFSSLDHLRKFVAKLIELADADPMTSAKALRS